MDMVEGKKYAKSDTTTSNLKLCTKMMMMKTTTMLRVKKIHKKIVKSN